MVSLLPSRNDVALPPLSQPINIPSVEEATLIGKELCLQSPTARRQRMAIRFMIMSCLAGQVQRKPRAFLTSGS
eukprot:11185046-Lingulodinium_polyedra.AAC.1